MTAWDMARWRFGLAAGVVAILPLGSATATRAEPGDTTLRRHIARLAADHGFAVEGIDQLDADAIAPAAGGAVGSAGLGDRLQALLADYSYMLTQKPGGGVRGVVVLGRKVKPPPPDEYRVPTRRVGRHHVVAATLVGPDGTRRAVRLMVDTGASSVVLPTSLMAALGFAPDALREAEMQTANKRVTGKVGRLRTVEVGGAEAGDVAVAFIDDDRLSGRALLGMSFLARFRMTIDDANNALLLVPR